VGSNPTLSASKQKARLMRAFLLSFRCQASLLLVVAQTQKKTFATAAGLSYFQSITALRGLIAGYRKMRNPVT
jgi:hypothetical protein